ncbi:MAG: MXAN_6640 family putative metalloprotease [bacterium]
MGMTVRAGNRGGLISRSLSARSVFLVFCLFFSFWLRSDHSCAQSPGSDRERQDIDQSQMRSWLNQEIAVLFNRRDNSRRYSSAGAAPSFFPRCATPLVQTARRHPELLDEQNRFILYRPTDATYQDNYYGKALVLAYTTADGHCRVHYTEDNRQGDAIIGSDGLVRTVPSYVLAVAKALETAWSREVETLGYSPPALVSPSDSSIRLDCYIMGIPFYGYSTVDPNSHPYMVISNDYSVLADLSPNQDPEGSALGAMKVSVAHELFHAIQYGYTDWSDQWWEENSAVWMEDEVFDSVNDYLHYLGNPYDDLNLNGRWDSGEPYYNSLGELAGFFDRKMSGWFDWPFLPIEASSATHSRAQYQEYGGSIWVKYLAEKYGPNIVRSIFERGKRLRQQGRRADALSLIKAELASRESSLDLEIEEFKVKLLTREFEEGEFYPQVWHAASFERYPVLFNSQDFDEPNRGGPIGNLKHLAAHYFRFQAPEGVGTLHLEFNRTYGTAPMSCPLVLTAQNGLTERIDIPLDPNCSGEIILPGFGKQGEFHGLTAIPVNTAEFVQGDLASFTLKADFTAALSFSSISFLAGMNLFSPPFGQEPPLDSHQFLLHYFAPDSVHSLSAYDRETGQWITNTLVRDSQNSPITLSSQASQAYSVSGPSFPLIPGGIYVLNLKAPQTITLPSSSPDSGLRLQLQLFRQGVNFFSLPSQAARIPGLPESAFELLHDLAGKVSAITQRNQRNGKWLSAYYFFQKPSGRDFAIPGEETSIVNMVQEEMWRGK